MGEIAKGCIWCYHGSKARYLEDIYNILPKEGNLKVLDLFTGGSSLGTSLPETWKVVANDKEDRVVAFSQYLQEQLLSNRPESIENYIKNYCRSQVTSRDDKEGYNILKSFYNKGDRSPLNLFALTMSSNSNMIRFNSKGEQTLQFGKRWYNNNSSKKMLSYLERLDKRDITFTSKDYKDFDFGEFNTIIADPPYLKTTATYNENGGWGLKDTVNLLSKLDKYSESGGKFLFFEEVVSKGVENTVVAEWASKYKVVELGNNSHNCNYQRKNKETKEVLVYNY